MGQRGEDSEDDPCLQISPGLKSDTVVATDTRNHFTCCKLGVRHGPD